MKGLYKGKYLIAVYDKYDNIIDVACSPRELKCFKSKKYALHLISCIYNGLIISNRIHLIDCTEKHDDVFTEEDQLFLDFIKETRHKTNKEKQDDMGITERTFYRKKSAFEKKKDK